MAAPQGYQSSDPRFPNGKYDGVTGQPTPEYQKELDKSAAASAEKQKADAAASQAQSKSNDDMAANMNNIAAQRNTPEVPQATTPNISTGADAEQAALDKMKQKNPKLAGMMAQDDNLDATKPDNTVQMPKRNKKPKGTAAESTRFDKLNFLFESIIAEAEQGDTQTPGVAKKSISQWVVDFFKKFMKGEDITSDPTIMQNVTALSKELEQNYTKDKGKTTIPKLADLAWSATHSPGEKDISQNQPEKTEKTNKTGGQGAAGTGGGGGGTTNIYNVFGQGAGSPQDAQKAKSAYQQIQSLLKGLTPANKQKILASLQKELANSPAKKTAPKAAPTGDTGGTYNKKTGAAKLGGKSMVAATDLPPNIQKQLQQK